MEKYYFKKKNKNRCPEWTGEDYEHVESVLEIKNWKINYGIVLNKHNYTGPYFIGCDHGCFHGKNTHGLGVITGGESLRDCITTYDKQHNEIYLNINEQNFALRGIKTVELCKKAIEKSDLIFAWIDDKTCFGTIAEIGYAKGKNKRIWIAGSEKIEDLWFAYSLADVCVFKYNNPKEALEYLLKSNPDFNSPIEDFFWKEWQESILDNKPLIETIKLHTQYKILNYFVDFAHIESKTVIELDGYEYHSSVNAIAYDHKRQRELEELGWNVIRFGGKEIKENVQQCVTDVINRIMSNLKK